MCPADSTFYGIIVDIGKVTPAVDIYLPVETVVKDTVEKKPESE